MNNRTIKFRAWYPNAKRCEEYTNWILEKKRKWKEDKVRYNMLDTETFEKETGMQYLLEPFSYMDYEVHISKNGKPMSLEGGWDYFGDNDDAIVMQFAGLLDKNGKEIYEGDILGTEDPEDDSKCYIAFKNGSFMKHYKGDIEEGLPFETCWDSVDSEIWVVIGNIYENPELLK